MARPIRFPHKRLVGIDDTLRDALEAWRRDQSPIPSDADAVRHILTDWLRERGYLG